VGSSNFYSKIILKICLILLTAAFFGPASVNAVERSYYSIHFASFKNLQNANRQVNSLKEKGKMVFWKETDVPGKGKYYRVYLGRYYNRGDAVAFWEKLNKIGAVGYFGIHRFSEEGAYLEKRTSRTTKDASTTSVSTKPDAHGAPPIPPTLGRFVDNQDGTVTDTQTRLMWIKNGWRLDFFSAATWFEAGQKLEDFKHGGHSNWRLPTIEEWKSIIDKKNENPAMVEPNPFVNIIGHMPYWTRTEFAYGRNHTLNKKGLLETYTVMLYSGTINHQKKSERAFILPVRSIN